MFVLWFWHWWHTCTYDLWPLFLFFIFQIFHLGLCAKCQAQQDAGVTKSNLFLGHVAKVLKYLKNKYPSVTFIMWDDMLRNCTVDQMKGKHWESNWVMIKSNLFLTLLSRDNMLRNCTLDQMKGKHWEGNFGLWTGMIKSNLFLTLLSWDNMLRKCTVDQMRGETEHCYLPGFAPASHTFVSGFCWLFVHFVSSPTYYMLYLKNIVQYMRWYAE